MTFDTTIQIVCTALIGVCAFSLNSMKEDISAMRESFVKHITDHAAHCKHPVSPKGC